VPSPRRPLTTEAPSLPSGLARSLALLDPARRPPAAPLRDGYLDLLGGEEDVGRTGLGQGLMFTRAVPAIYEHLWRPALGRVAKGPLGPGMAEEKRIARLLLGLGTGDGVLDIGCGTGNFTRTFAQQAGPTGLVVGFDASHTMLARAVADTPEAREDGGQVAYVRGDAVRLPFRDATFDAVCCFAALHMMDEPFAALDEMARVLTPGGRLALLTSCRTRTAPLRTFDGLLGERTGMRMFERDEITSALTARGFSPVRRRISGLAQFVGGRKAA
jgi:SAM-dependent methyltransferase